MSIPEIAFRIAEYGRRMMDRRRTWSWSDFGFAGEIAGIAGLAPLLQLEPKLKRVLAAEAEAAIAGRFVLLGQAWHLAPDAPWWDGDFWLTDPVSRTSWPGAAQFAFDVAYRDHPGRGDVKFVWELNRLQFLPSLALHTVLSNDPECSDRIFEILRGWMRANPPYRGVNWISGIEAASRVVSLLTALTFVRSRTSEDDAAVRAFLHAHVRWIARYPSRFSSANNHRVAELTALLLATVLAPGLPDAERWSPLARRGLEREIVRQFHSDGVGAEQSVFYAAYVLEWFALAGIVADTARARFSQAYKDRAGSASEYLSALLDETGRTPRIGDADDGRVLATTQANEPLYVASVAAVTARWLGQPQPFRDLRDLAFRDVLGDPTAPSSRPEGLRTFRSGGMSIWRRSRRDGDLLLAFDHGPLGHLSIAAHGHADALACWMHWGDEIIFADPGTYLYHDSGGERDRLRGTGAHNTLCLGGRDQSRMIGPFAWASHARTTLLDVSQKAVEAEHDGYRRRFGLTHRRRIEVGGDVIQIEDRVLGRPKATDLPWAIGFTLAPEVSAQVRGSHVAITTSGGRRLSMDSNVEGGSSVNWRLIETPYAIGFGMLSSTGRLELSGVLASKPLVVKTRIVLSSEPHHDRPA